MEWLSDSWEWIVSLFSAVDWSLWGVWSLTLSLILAGLLGAILPFVPGPLLIFLAAALHTWLRPESAMSWPGLVILALLLIAAYVIDAGSGAVGAKWFGASKWGMIGVLVGGVVGLFLGIPGLILGPIVGAFTFELLFAKKNLKPAAQSTWGTVVGTGVGLVARLVLSLVMVAVFFVDALWW